MNSRTGIGIVVALLLLGGFALIVYSSMGLQQVTGEICISFNGRTECRTASGADRAEAMRTAATMACAVLASGMTQRIDCERTPPTRVTWQD